jgi:serine O-acetyltransferase
MRYDGHTVKAWAGDSQWRALRADLARFRLNGYSGWGSEGFWALAIYRLQKSAHSARPNWAWAPARFVLRVLKKIFTLVTHMSIDYQAKIGPGMLIPHGGPIRVHGDTEIGADCCLQHVCTIGAGRLPGGAAVGDHVWIGCHSSIIGPVTIGDGAMIAANSLVIDDVPALATAMGVPARILPGNQKANVKAVMESASSTSSLDELRPSGGGDASTNASSDGPQSDKNLR